MKKPDYLNCMFTISDGSKVVVIEHISYINCTIKFEDGTILKNIRLSNLKTGKVKYPTNYNGMIFTTRQGYEATIIKHIDCNKNIIQFNDERKTILENVTLGNLRTGKVSNPYHKSVFGIGFLGLGRYKSTSGKGSALKSTKYYTVWLSMFTRCYSKNVKKDYPTYVDCSVDERWHNFQVFAEWFEKNYNPETMQGWQLDKDIKVKGNKIYSPESCLFIPKDINCFSLSRIIKKSEMPQGVYFSKQGNKYIAEMSRFGKRYKIGRYTTPEEASLNYSIAKEKHARELAEVWKENEDIYNYLINFKVSE